MVSYLTTNSWASLPDVIYQYYVLILMPVTDNLLFLNQRKREIFPPKNVVPDERVYLGTAAYKADTLIPTKLPYLIFLICVLLSAEIGSGDFYIERNNTISYLSVSGVMTSLIVFPRYS